MLLLSVLLIPLCSSLILALLGARHIARSFNIVASLLTFAISCGLCFELTHIGKIKVADAFYLDILSGILLLITTFIGATSAIFSRNFLFNEQRAKQLSRKNVRFYHSLYQFFFFASNLILITNNLGILWVAMECATLSTVLLIGLYHIPYSLEAAWKYLILCGLGLAQALLGTILIYFAGEHVLSSHDALLWTSLQAANIHLAPHIASLAFVFILVGYGTKAGFVPLHNWLPDVYAEGIPPILAILSGVLLNMAFYAILRVKMIVDGSVGANFTNSFLLGFGVLSLLIAAFFLLRQREIKRLFAYSSIEHIGIISFAFGLGTPLARTAGLLHMVAHALSKSAAFFSVGFAMQSRNTVAIEQCRGLHATHPALGWGLLLSTLALLACPPSPLFLSELLIVYTSVQQHFWLTLLFLSGLVLAFAAVLHHLQHMVFSKHDTSIKMQKITVNLTPIYLHLLVLITLFLLFASQFRNILNLVSQRL